MSRREHPQAHMNMPSSTEARARTGRSLAPYRTSYRRTSEVVKLGARASLFNETVLIWTPAGGRRTMIQSHREHLERLYISRLADAIAFISHLTDSKIRTKSQMRDVPTQPFPTRACSSHSMRYRGSEVTTLLNSGVVYAHRDCAVRALSHDPIARNGPGSQSTLRSRGGLIEIHNAIARALRAEKG